MRPRSSIVSEGVLIFNDKGQVLVAGPGTNNLFHYSKEELTGLFIHTLFADGLSVLKVYRLAVQEQKDYVDEWKEIDGITKEGDRFKIKVSLSQFQEGDELLTVAFIAKTENSTSNAKKRVEEDSVLVGEITQKLDNLETTNRDLQEQIKKRKETEQKLMIFQRLYDTMVHNFPDGVIGILNKEMEYILIDGKELNEIDLPALGLNGHQTEGQDPVLAQETISRIKKAFAGEDVSFEVNTEDRSYSITAVPLPDAKNQINEILCVLKNVTEKKRVESVLLKALEKEKELGELKSRFVTMACHEFKTPLATILSSTFLLENYSGEAYDNEKLLHSNRIRRSVNNLNTILNEFLSIETQKANDVTIVFGTIDIPKYIRDILQEVESLRKQGQIIDYQHTGSQTTVDTDQHLLWSILTNLISNALKYTGQGGLIQVTTAIKDNLLTIVIKDNGIGIPAEEHKYIFERFYRAPNAINYEGTGIGLHIVRKNVRLLKGSISFISELNKGTEFAVTLPISEEVV